MQKQRNIRLLLILGGLVTLLTLLPYFKERKGLNIDKRQFTLDPQIVITDVVLTSKKATNKLSYVQGDWLINAIHPLDPNMRDVFFSVLSQMEIRKEIPQSQQDSLIQLIKNEGTEVEIFNNSEVVKHYFIWGDSESQTSFVINEDKDGYMVHIPGYRSFVAGIFQVPPSDWRSRRTFTAMFTNLNSLKIKYQTDSIEFRYKNSFFEIVGMDADSTQLITSLENLLFLQTDQYLAEEELAKYEVETVTKNAPMVLISASKLSGATEYVRIFDTSENQPYFIGLSPDSSFCLFNKKRLQKLLVKKSDFE
ncbi:MAG: hypothetical protein L3J06_10375 [Cyclobacteriaceae bacterium]|nr:hypothetical protein [Cyclobacteriaceae bacterium]